MSLAKAASLPPRDPGGRLKGKALQHHNERAYRAKGWVKRRDGTWGPPIRSVGPSTATLARVSPDTNKESALREKQAVTQAYRRRAQQNRQTRWGAKLYS